MSILKCDHYYLLLSVSVCCRIYKC